MFLVIGVIFVLCRDNKLKEGDSISFESNDGTLKEVVYNDVLRQGNSEVNKIYIYYDKPEVNITGVQYKYEYDDGTTSIQYADYQRLNGIYLIRNKT